MSDQNLHKGHRERIRQKFLDFGAESLLEHELLELILFYAIPRVNTNKFAHNLINNLGNLNDILNADVNELTEFDGIGKKSAWFLKFLSDVCNEYKTFSSLSIPVTASENLSAYFRDYFLNSKSGLCLLLGIDDNFKIKNKISFTESSLMKDNSEIRKIAEFLIKNNCIRIVIGINHPERTAIPDNNDFALIKFLAEKFVVLNIILIDCVICSNNDTFSLKQHGAFSFEE